MSTRETRSWRPASSLCALFLIVSFVSSSAHGAPSAAGGTRQRLEALEQLVPEQLGLINVRDLSASGDGVADDGGAIRAAAEIVCG